MKRTRERIAIVTTSFPRTKGDAAGHFVAAEAAELARGGAEVVVLAAGRGDWVPPTHEVHFLGGEDLFDWPGALHRLRQRPSRLGSGAVFVHRARRALAELGPFDRVIAHWLLPSAWPIATTLHPARKGTVEAVAHGSDVRLLLSMPAWLRNAILLHLAHGAVRLRFVSEALRSELLDAPGLYPKIRAYLRTMSYVHPATIDMPHVPTRLEARGRLGVRDTVDLVVVAGRLVEGKRIDVAVSAGLLLPRARVVVLGDGPLHDELVERFPEAEFLGRVPRENALEWIAAADVLVSCSKQEGAPTVIREARAIDVPVVASACGDLEGWAQIDSDLWVV